MSRTPTRQLTELYARIMNNPNTGIKSKNYDAMYVEKANEVILWHYGTLILRINLNDGSWMPGRGYSVSDRDAINSFLMLANSTGYAYIRDHKIHYCINGFIKHTPEEFTEYRSRVRIMGLNVMVEE